MALPKPIERVPRDQVHAVAQGMLLSPATADVTCKEAKDPAHKITPRPRKEGGA
jgi:hypothetical protein